MTRRIEQYFEQYAESHQNPFNKAVHWVCVPLIVLSLLGLVWSIPTPEFFPRYLNWATFLIAFAFGYYLRLSVPLALAMGVFISLGSALIVYTEMRWGISAMRLLSLAIFAGSWVFQFIGHKVEGKKPSFLQDVKFLLVGPVWLLHFLFRKAGIRY